MPQRRQLPVRAKLFVFLCAVSLLPLFLSSRVLISLGGRSLRTLRELQVRDGLDQSMRAINAAQARLTQDVRVVAQWEDLQGFLKGRAPSWPKENLEGWAPQSYRLDYLAITDTTGEVLYQWNPTGAAPAEILSPLFQQPDSLSSGWISTPRDLFLLSRSEVISNGIQSGILIFGRRLTHRFLLELQTAPNQELMIFYGGRLLATTDTTSSFPLIEPGEIFSALVPSRDIYLYEDRTQNRLIGFKGFKNVADEEVAAVGWTGSQSPALLVQETINKILLYFGLPLLALVLLAALILGLWIERPIRNLSRTMEEVSQTGDLSRRVPVSGGGEISSMSKSFNQMLEQLSRQRDELMTFQTMILAMKEGVLIEDANQNIIYVNARMEEMLGISFGSYPVPSSESQLARKITSKGQAMEDTLGFSTEEVEWVRPDGIRVQALKTSGRLEDPLGKVTGTLSTFVDVTERNELELELIENSRMAFLGLYSQGIIHNLNGPLNSILGFSSLLCRHNPQAELPLRIRKDAERLFNLTSSLGRRWQRTGTHQRESVNLNEIVLDGLSFLEADLFYKHNVNKKLELDDGLPAIQGNYGDFSHALLNVLVNAIDALRESQIHELTVRSRCLNDEIRIEIEDTGIGIRQEHLNRIFLPFFSTKARRHEEGLPGCAGLGLPIARKILEPYGVKFEVRSQVGKGTCMILHVPLSRNALTGAVSTHELEVSA